MQPKLIKEKNLMNVSAFLVWVRSRNMCRLGVRGDSCLPDLVYSSPDAVTPTSSHSTTSISGVSIANVPVATQKFQLALEKLP